MGIENRDIFVFFCPRLIPRQGINPNKYPFNLFGYRFDFHMGITLNNLYFLVALKQSVEFSICGAGVLAC